MALTKAGIAAAGLRVLNEVGLNGLTLRLIAEELDVKAPALYWHLKNKQELLDEMATQMFREVERDFSVGAGNADWVEVIREHSRGLRRMLLRYRDGAKVFSGTFFTDTALPNEGVLRALCDAGFAPKRASRALFTVYSYVIGCTIEEQAVYPEPGKRDERYDDLRSDRPDVEPWLLDAVGAGVFGDPDAQFEDGLAIVLAGARVWLGAD